MKNWRISKKPGTTNTKLGSSTTTSALPGVLRSNPRTIERVEGHVRRLVVGNQHLSAEEAGGGRGGQGYDEGSFPFCMIMHPGLDSWIL